MQFSTTTNGGKFFVRKNAKPRGGLAKDQTFSGFFFCNLPLVCLHFQIICSSISLPSEPTTTHFWHRNVNLQNTLMCLFLFNWFIFSVFLSLRSEWISSMWWKNHRSVNAVLFDQIHNTNHMITWWSSSYDNMKDGLYGLINHIVEKSGDATQQRKEQVKIGLLS